MGLGATIITFSPTTTIRSADANSNNTALNSVTTPSFTSVTLHQPPILASGYQETGRVGFVIPATAANQWVGGLTNFKTVMTNIPSSLTITGSASSNVPTPLNVTNIDINGFNVYANTSAASTTTYFIGSYTTVGNCLLAVHPAARAFDHHCDACQREHHGVAVTEMIQAHAPFGWSLAYQCPDCGVPEHFHTEFCAADEANPAPQGHGDYLTTAGAQAALIRQAMTLLQMPVRP